MRKCTVNECDKKHHARGWCRKHHERWLKHGTVEDSALFKRGRPRNDLVAENKENLYQYLRYETCMDCGEDRWAVLEFDHVRDEKIEMISYMVQHDYLWTEILKEIDKCDIVCTNCHKLREDKRANRWRTRSS